MPAHLVVSQVMPAPSADVFALLHDYHRRLEWDTLLRAAYTLGDEPPAVGVEAVCQAARRLGGITFQTRYVTFQPPIPAADGEPARPGLAAVTLVRPTAMFSTWAASIRHAELTPGLSSVTYTTTFTCRPTTLAHRLEPTVKQAFRLETSKRLRALADFLGGGA